MSAEYILSGGNMHVMVCESSIRTFEPLTRFTFDVNAIPVIRPSHHPSSRTQPTVQASGPRRTGSHGGSHLALTPSWSRFTPTRL